MPRKGGVPGNLKPFQKGQSGNPSGKAKTPWRDWVANVVDPVARELLFAIMQSKRVKVETRVRIAQWFEDHAHGTPKATVETQGGPHLLVVSQELAKRMNDTQLGMVATTEQELPPDTVNPQ